MNTTLLGNVDLAHDGIVAGWAFDPGAPDRRIALRVAIDDTNAGEFTADLFRADLLAAGVGDGRHGFHHTLPLALRHVAGGHVTVSEVGTNRIVPGTPHRMEWPSHCSAEQFALRQPWLDSPDGLSALDEKRRLGMLDTRAADLLQRFARDGFVVIERAVPHSLLDQVWKDVDSAWDDRPKQLVNVQGIGERLLSDMPPREALPTKTFRLMDFHSVSEAAAEVMMAPTVMRFLRQWFDETPVAMQTLTFEYGTEQRSHMDFPYVHTRHPAKLAAAWVACEDVTEDAGPLFYFVGSHRSVPKYDFGGGNILTFGDGDHVRAFETYLETTCVALGLERRTFLPRKGDVLIWHSALVHGGSPRSDPGRTRRSIVSHYSTPSSYPRDRRSPAEEPRVIERNGGRYYGWRSDGHVEGRYPCPWI